MNFFKKCPFLSTIVILSLLLFFYGILLAAKVVKASNSVNLSSDPETVGVATGVQDIKVRLQNLINGINERDYSVDYMPTEYVPDDELVNNFGVTVDDSQKRELTEEEKAEKEAQDALDAEAAARRADRSERMRNGEADDVIREAMKNVLDENDASTPGDTYDGFYTVGDDYFNGGDTVIIGDSREQGFGMYSGLNVVNYAMKSYGVHQVFTKKWIDSEFGKLTLEEAMAANQGKFRKIYIKFGLNEMGWADEQTFDNAYYQLIDMLKYYQKDAVIYVQSIISVTRSKDSESNVFNNKNIMERNEALKKVAANEHVAYLDLNSALADEEGFLPDDYASDGIHMKQKYMHIWVEFLKKHAVMSGEKDAEYITGNGTYEPGESDAGENDSVSSDDIADPDEGEDEAAPEAVSGNDASDKPSEPAEPAKGDNTGNPPVSTDKDNIGENNNTPGSWETGDDIK